MRYLFLSNYYPPHALGGYEQWCQEVADELVARGHDVIVLTSTSAIAAGGSEPNTSLESEPEGAIVHRKLHLEIEGGLWKTAVRLCKDRHPLEQENHQTVQVLVDEFKPDAAMIWGMWNMPRSVPALVETLMGGRVTYYICDYWLSLPSAYVQRWQEDARRGLMQHLKQLLSIPFLYMLQNEHPVGLALEQPICVSDAVRKILVGKGVPVGHARTVHGGTQLGSSVEAASTNQNSDGERAEKPLRLVFGGRLVADKGVHTVLSALGKLVAQGQHSVTLDIYGSGDEEYVAYLHQLVSEQKLEEIVTFHGSIPRAKMPTELSRYNVFIFASEWQEPFARSVLEAMAAGLVVVGTLTGGTGEILVENVTGLTYPAGDANALANQLIRLLKDVNLLERLAIQGRQIVEEQFTFERMVNDLEGALIRASNHVTERQRDRENVTVTTLQTEPIVP